MESQPNIIDVYPGAVEAHPGALKTHPAAVEAHFQDVKAYPWVYLARLQVRGSHEEETVTIKQ
jgi:hypothetical protein